MDAMQKLQDWVSTHNFRCNCPTHGDTAALLNGKCVLCQSARDVVTQKSKLEEEIEAKKLNMGCSQKFLHAKFTNYIVKKKSQQLVFKSLEDYCLNKNILLNGNPGCGKTHLAWALVDKFLRQKVNVRYIKYYQMFRLKQEKWSAYENALDSKFLIIDEIGLSSTDSKNQEVAEIIEYRYQKGYTMLISNLNNNDLAGLLIQSTWSRLREELMHLTTDWEDYRLNNKF